MLDVIPDPVVLPSWATRLCLLLDQRATTPGIAERIADGRIKPADSLQYDLGISQHELASIAKAVNIQVIATELRQNSRSVTASELYTCKSVVDLMNLVLRALEGR